MPPPETSPPRSCVALVCRREADAAALRDHLAGQLASPPVVCTFDRLGHYLSRECDGLVLAVLTGDDGGELAALVQDVSLREIPVSVAAVRCAGADRQPLPVPTPYLEGAYHWPADAAALAELARRYEGCRTPFADTDGLPLELVLRRRLLEQTPSLAPLVDRIALAARHDITVLLTGDTGTGKTFCARLIHDYSPRKVHRFLTISCGALAPNLIESEFFGHVRGAFTGADRNKVGKFEAVGEGTILLDEIDTLSLKHQAALLRVIETGEFEPVGSVETRRCRARIIVASNVPLERAVEQGAFRPDLYFRLNVMSFHFPPLRERVQDIAPLAQAMAAHYNRKFGKGLYHLSSQVLSALEMFPWPGNLRQLENAVQHGVLVSSGPEMLLPHLPEAIQENFLYENQPPQANGHTLSHQRDQSERNAIHRALVSSGYNRSRAASMLGISRVTLYKKMEKYGLTEIPIQQRARTGA